MDRISVVPQCTMSANRFTQYPFLYGYLRLICVSLLLVLYSSQLKAGGPIYWRIANVERGSTVNIRSGPSVEFRIIGELTASDKDIRNEGCSPAFTANDWQTFSDVEASLALNMRWCRVSYKDLNGWVYGEFLQLQE